MKPLFTLEKEFIERQLNIILPEQCWRENSKIYLNLDKNTKLLEFNVDNFKLSIKKNFINETLMKFKNISWDEEVLKHSERIDQLEKISISKTVEFIKEKEMSAASVGVQLDLFNDLSSNRSKCFDKEHIRISTSTGKDSQVAGKKKKKALETLNLQYTTDFLNTSNDTGETFKAAKSIPGINIVNPEIGFYSWLSKEKNYFLPTVNARTCCSKYKEDRLFDIFNKNEEYIIFLGVRKHESAKRKYLDFDVNKAALNAGKKLNVSPSWHRFAPIVDWTDEDVWLYILKHKLKINPMYYKGFNRVGCLICPYSSSYADVLIKEYYPKQFSRWESILKTNYNLYGVKKRLKWTFDEWKEGKWKSGQSKEAEIISKGYNNDTVAALASLKGISTDLAKEFFVTKCTCCGGKINPTELSMSYKFIGRNRKNAICKKCFMEKSSCTAEQYKEMSIAALESGCSLF